MAKYQTIRRRLLKEIVCPHCWATFPPENVLWISEDLSLVGDERLGETERSRFLPTEYNEYGEPLDAKETPCRDMACPRCHLKIPASSLDSPSVFMSIVGAPGCGKSYYLASSTWSLRRVLPVKFKVNFTDADPAMNHRLQEYESLQFLNEGSGLVRIEKTEEQGDLYDAIRMGDQTIVLPQPFVFLATRADAEPSATAESESYSSLVCLYDNAGESYLPSNDLASNPVTRHLSKSKCVFFLFDPTQDPRFRRALINVLGEASTIDESAAANRTPLRQETIFAETARRIRALRHMSTNERFEDLLVVIVSKADVWMKLSPSIVKILSKEPYSRASGSERYGLRSDKIEAASAETRAMLQTLTPEFISDVEKFARNVLYIPVSATGVAPSFDSRTNSSGFRVEDMRPIWATAPMLYALNRLTRNLILSGRSTKE